MAWLTKQPNVLRYKYLMAREVIVDSSGKSFSFFLTNFPRIRSVVTDKSLFGWQKGEKVCVICLIQFLHRDSSINHVVVMIFFFLE